MADQFGPVWTSLEPSSHPTVQPGKLWMFNLLANCFHSCEIGNQDTSCKTLGLRGARTPSLGQSVIIHFPSPLESQETSHCSKIFTSLVKKKAKGIRRTVLRLALKDLVKCCPTMPLANVFPGLYPWQQHVPTLEIESLFQNLPDIVT